MMRPERVGVGQALDGSGLGVGAIASEDANSVSVLLWNYAGADRTVPKRVVVLLKLPASLAGQSLTAERYLVDASHSNYASNSNKDGLQRVDDVPVSPSGRVDLGTVSGNSVNLLIIHK